MSTAHPLLPGMRTLFARIALGGLLSVSQTLFADTTLTYADTGRENLVRISDGKIRLDPARSESWLLFDSARRDMAIVDTRKREYVRIDEAQADSLRRSADGLMGQMEAQIAKLPPSMQQQARQAMGSLIPQPAAARSVRLESTGQRRSAAGFGCDFKRVLVDGQLESELCLSPAKNLGLPAGDLAAVLALQQFARALAGKADGYLSIDPRVFGDGDQIPLIYSIPRSSIRGTLTRITHARLEPGLLAVPEGFRQRPLALPFQ